MTTPEPAAGDLGHRYPMFMPDGRHVGFVSIHGDGRHRIKMVDLARKTVTDLGPSASAVVPVPGYRLGLDPSISDDAHLQVQPFNAAGTKPLGDARRIVTAILTSNIGYPNIAANANLLVVQRITGDLRSRLEWRDVRDGTSTAMGFETNVNEITLSPDGRRLSMMMGPPFDLWIRDMDGGGRRRLTFDGGFKFWATWSPDGRQIAYSQQFNRNSNGGYEVRVQSTDGVGEARTLFQGPGLFSSPMSWTADGRELLVCASDSTGTFQLYVVPIAGGGKARLHAPRPRGRDQVRLSPDGRWLAYLSAESGRSEAWIESYPDASTRYQASSNGAIRLEWMEGGRRLAFVDSRSQLWTVEVTSGAGLTLGTPRASFLVPGDVTHPAFDPQGSRVLVPVPQWEAGIGSFEAILGWQALVPKS